LFFYAKTQFQTSNFGFGKKSFGSTCNLKLFCLTSLAETPGVFSKLKSGNSICKKMVEEEVEIQLKTELKRIFGYSQFRGNQEKIVKNLMSGKNTFVIMPTGAGKSLCYQLPAVIKEGTAIVISPLIALMKNQVDQLNALGVNACFLNSTLSKPEITKVRKDTVEGKVKLLYVAPESLNKDENIEFLREANVSFVAIDEAHCISEWGHDFRPEYRKIRSIIERIGELPIIALTATATPKVQQDIIKNLHMEDATVFMSSFNRPNLYYEVRPKLKEPEKQLIKFVKNFKNQSGIVYCLSRKKVEEIAEILRINDIKALPYHAGLDSHVRIENQDAFLNEDCEVVVATIAFGMGIDKPDVRFVVHYDAPKSLEGYYQETGRAGRDGLEGHCMMLYSYTDIVKLEKFNKDKSVTERDNAKHLLKEMAQYANTAACRRRQILHYFGEIMEKDCGYCDNCKSQRVAFEGKEYALTILKTILETNERFEAEHLTDIIRGVETQAVVSYEHDKVSTFKTGAEQSVDFWISAIRQVLLFDLITKDVEKIDVLKITERGKAFLEKPHSLQFYKDHDFSAAETDMQHNENELPKERSYDKPLFEMLKKLRKKVAKEKGLPPFVIFQDPSLEEMATTYPTTEQELAQINGVGMGKVKKFGKYFLDFIKKYVEDNEIVTAKDVVIKSTANKSKLKISIIQQIDLKNPLEDIAETKNISMEELIQEIEHICYSGTKLNLDYYIDSVLDEEKQDEIFDYFMEAEHDGIREAMEFFGDDYSEEELRLMRIKFLSEYAM
jgi:ATP-dependent DNA helicase RecQ